MEVEVKVNTFASAMVSSGGPQCSCVEASLSYKCAVFTDLHQIYKLFIAINDFFINDNSPVLFNTLQATLKENTDH